MFDPRWDDARTPRRAGARHEVRDPGAHDPRDGLLHNALDLPRGDVRELVVDRDRVSGLNGED